MAAAVAAAAANHPTPAMMAAAAAAQQRLHSFHPHGATPAMSSPPNYPSAYNHGCSTGFGSVVQHQQPSPLGKFTSHTTSLSSPIGADGSAAAKPKRSFTIASLIADDSDSSDDEQPPSKQKCLPVDEMLLLDADSADSSSSSASPIPSDDESEVDIEAEDADDVTARSNATSTPLKNQRSASRSPTTPIIKSSPVETSRISPQQTPPHLLMPIPSYMAYAGMTHPSGVAGASYPGMPPHQPFHGMFPYAAAAAAAAASAAFLGLARHSNRGDAPVQEDCRPSSLSPASPQSPQLPVTANQDRLFQQHPFLRAADCNRDKLQPSPLSPSVEQRTQLPSSPLEHPAGPNQHLHHHYHHLHHHAGSFSSPSPDADSPKSKDGGVFRFSPNLRSIWLTGGNRIQPSATT